MEDTPDRWMIEDGLRVSVVVAAVSASSRRLPSQAHPDEEAGELPGPTETAGFLRPPAETVMGEETLHSAAAPGVPVRI